LKDPRERYLSTAQVLTFGLAIPHGVGMPAPKF
jgi:hypothetical protein